MRDELRRFLESPRDLRTEIDRLKKQRQADWELATSITQGYAGMPGGGGQEGPKSSWTNLLEHDAKLAERINEYLRAVDRVQNFISKVPDPVQRLVLELRYINGMKWPEVEDALFGEYSYSLRNIYNIHGRALSSARRIWEEDIKNEPRNLDKGPVPGGVCTNRGTDLEIPRTR